GMKVIVRGDLIVYEADGKLEIRANNMFQSGVGDLAEQLEKLKLKLKAEGLFEEDHKKPLPPYPFSIGIITGNHTAALEDMYNRLNERWPIAKTTLYPASVQGKDAAPTIIAALKKADEANHDLLILGRGGGSIEDLWCFNDESLARAIYELNTPIVTGIGHEIDFTIADFVADKRANTPTGAIEISTPTLSEVKDKIEQYKSKLQKITSLILQQKKQALSLMKKSPYFLDSSKILEYRLMHMQYLREKLFHTKMLFQDKEVKIKQYQTRLQKDANDMCKDLSIKINQNRLSIDHALKEYQNKQIHKLQEKIKLLDAYSPLKVMARGYSLVENKDKVIHQADEATIGDELKITLSKGKLYAEVTKVEDDYGKEKYDM
ncbi:MAG: exodeoxyribonuclease VII large subunit, partial [Solobacterium sp.]|nr:exodeoxyribonuclease VII large subunit [Solobacterium sp.]